MDEHPGVQLACSLRIGTTGRRPRDLRPTCGTWLRQHEVEPHLIGAMLPTDLPEGAELELVPAHDDMTDEQRREVLAGIREGLAQVKAGQSIDADEVIAELLAD